MNSLTVKFTKTHPDAKIPAAQRLGDVGYDLSSVEDVVLAPSSVTKVRTGLKFADVAAEETRGDNNILTLTKEGKERRKSWSSPIEFGDARVGSVTPCAVFPQVLGRGGLASEGIFPVGGVVDSNYRGELVVLLANINVTPKVLPAGSRCAQLVFQKVLAYTQNSQVLFEEVTEEEVTSTERNDKGFGSSGQ